MRKKTIFYLICISMLPLLSLASEGQFTFIDWVAETEYQAKVNTLFQTTEQEEQAHALAIEESFFDLISDRNFQQSEHRSEILSRALDRSLKNGNFNSFIQLLLRRFRDLDQDCQRSYLQQALLYNRNSAGIRALEEELLSLYERHVDEDDWLVSFSEKNTSFLPEASWTWEQYNYPGYPFKNLNFPLSPEQAQKEMFDQVKGEIFLDPEQPKFQIHLEFTLLEEQDGSSTFQLSPLAQDLHIKSGDEHLEYSRNGTEITFNFPDEGAQSLKISYEIKDLIRDDNRYLGNIFGFLNPQSLTMPLFPWGSSAAVSLELSGLQGLSVLLPGKNFTISDDDSLHYEQEKMEYDKLFVAYTPDNSLRRRTIKRDGNTVEILSYSGISAYTVRIENMMQRLNLTHDPIVIALLPSVDTHLFYPGLAVINEGHVRRQNTILYLHFAHAVFQGEMMTFRSREEELPIIAGFIENTAMKAVNILSRNAMSEYRRQLQQIYEEHHDSIRQDQAVNIVFQGSTLYNYLCGRDYSNNRALYNYLRRNTGRDFTAQAAAHFRTEARDPWQQMMTSWQNNGYLPQFVMEDPTFIIWSNLKQELRILLKKIDITFPVPVELKITMHDQDVLYKNFVIHRISSLFVFPTPREVIHVELDPSHYYLKHPDHMENYQIEITRDNYQYRPASGMFR